MSSSSLIAPTMQDTIRAMAYKTPAGYVDVPYCYMYDASGLTDGDDYQGLTVTVDQNTDFVLRRVVGLNKVIGAGGRFQARDKSLIPFFNSPIKTGLLPAGFPVTGATTSGSWPVLPEKVYPASSQISFDLYDVNRSAIADVPTIYASAQLGFWGVRRFRQGQFYTHNTPYKYHELDYTYEIGLAVNWGHWTDNTHGIASLPRQFSIPVLEADFELCSVQIVNLDGGATQNSNFQFRLYAPDGYTFLSNAPVNLNYLNGAPTNYRYGNPVFPVPSLVWPVKSLITFEITSLLPFGTAKSYQISFRGIWRARD